MSALTYIRLIGFTGGTLLMLFWMVVILGYRRQRNFERVFFFLCLAFFLFYSGSLLALNAQIYYSVPQRSLQLFSASLIALGLCFLPPLLLQVHAEYAETRDLLQGTSSKRIGLTLMYAPALYFALKTYSMLAAGQKFDILLPGTSLGRLYGLWLFVALFVSMLWEAQFKKIAPRSTEAGFHSFLKVVLGVSAIAVQVFHFWTTLGPRWEVILGTALAFCPIPPLAVLIYLVQKRDFLQFGRQKNLVYAVTVTFFALLYLSLVRRVSATLEPILPPEASAAILLFVLVIFVEPLQRLLSRRLQKTAQEEMDRTQRILVAIQEVARLGEVEKLRRTIKELFRDNLGLADVDLELYQDVEDSFRKSEDLPRLGSSFPIRQSDRVLGTLIVRPYGGMVSGETNAAIEFLCEQLPASINLCRTLEEKLQLERELAERERLALVGQTAASISHNLKNPLGSIKTILQVQLENPEMPESMRGETKMVLEEINRLSAKLNQLLQFSRPAVRGTEVPQISDAVTVLREVVEVLRPEADRRRISLRMTESNAAIPVAASAEALNDILSNVIVNALEATISGGAVSAAMNISNGHCLITVEDDGPGIPPAILEKILQPFFTTKSQGTGLGLAIAARRVSEFSGKLEFSSPISAGRGTRFEITLPLIQEAS